LQDATLRIGDGFAPAPGAVAMSRTELAPLPVRPIEIVLGRLDKVRKTGKGWTARCPAHEDHTPSLSISETEDGTVLVHCFAGCLPEEVCGAIGLNLGALFNSRTGEELMRKTRMVPWGPRAKSSGVSFRPASPGRLGGNESPPKPLPYGLLARVLENVPPEPSWAWRGYLAPGAITLLAGRPKVGKSTLLFALVAALEAGEPLVELDTRAVGALLLSEEREATLADKAHRWDMDGRVHLLMRHQANGWNWRDVVHDAVDYCQRHELGVLIVDTWDKWTGLKGDAENNAGAILEALEPLVQAAASGLAVLICAHQRKSSGDFGDAVRGSNALTGGVDVVLELERPRSDSLSGEGVRVLQAVSRFSATPDELVIALADDGYEARGDALTATAEVEQRQIIATLEALGEADYKTISEDTDLSRSTVQRRLEELGDRVVKRGKGKRGDPFLFSAHSLTGREEIATPDEEEIERLANLSRETPGEGSP
jgi:hypothetical protein